MRNIFNSFLTILVIGLLCFYNVYKSVCESISLDSVHYQVKNNLLSGFIYDDNGDYSDIFRTILNMTNLDSDVVVRLMENDTVDKYLTDIINSIYDYRLTGDSSYKYSGKYIINLVEDNMDQVLLDIDYHLSSKDRDCVINYLHNNIDDIMFKIYDIDIGVYTR